MTGAEGAEDVRALLHPTCALGEHLMGHTDCVCWCHRMTESRPDGDAREHTRAANLEDRIGALEEVRAQMEREHAHHAIPGTATCYGCGVLARATFTEWKAKGGALLEGGSRDAPTPTSGTAWWCAACGRMREGAHGAHGAHTGAARPPVDPPLPDAVTLALAMHDAGVDCTPRTGSECRRLHGKRAADVLRQLRAAYEGRGTPEARDG